MSILFAHNYAEIISAVSEANSGDVIVLTSSTYSSTSNLTINKSISFEVDESIRSTTITLNGSNFISITGSAGNKVVMNWSGDITITSGSVVFSITSSSGPIESNLSGITLKNVSSFPITADASNSFDCVINCNNCTFTNTTAGIKMLNSGSSNFNVKSQLTLDRCVLEDLQVFGSIDMQNYSTLFIKNSTITQSIGVTIIKMSDAAVANISNTTLKTTATSAILDQSSSGSTTFLNCDVEYNASSGIPIDITSGEFIAKSSSFKSTSVASMISSSTGSGSVYLSDCALTQTGNLSGTDLINFSGSVGEFVRCVIDASGSTGTGSGTHYAINATGIAKLTLLGNVIINPEKTTGGVGSVLIPNGITAEVSHNTIVRNGTQAATNDGLFLNGDYTVRGNIFSNLDKALIPGGTSDYFYNANSGYNVFYNNVTDIEGGIDFKSTDHPSIPYDPFVDSINKNYRLVLGTVANKLDPNDAKQIDYHQMSTDIFGNGTVGQNIVPDIDLADIGPTDAGAYNNQGISYTITLLAEPDQGWFFGRFQGEEISQDNPYSFTLTQSQVVSVYFYSHVSPHLTSPQGGEIYNLGQVSIEWDQNAPVSFFPSQTLSYDIEYTDNYKGRETNWYTLKRRIPWNVKSFEWIVGKSIKSNKIRIRIRSRSIDGNVSDWSMISGDFSINIFKLIPPTIISPRSNYVYTDFILVILDESSIKNTFNQKVRYTLEYSSEKMKIGFTTIAKDVPVGQNVIRWDLESIPPSDDYTLKLTVKNSSTCLEPKSAEADQIAKRFVYNLKIQQPGMFLIDTVPPQAVLELENNLGITNEVTQVLNIFAEDATTEITQIQLRECNTSHQLALGDISDENLGTDDCVDVDNLISDSSDFNTIVGKPLGYSTKTQWTFKDESGKRKLEALLTDAGGNTSLQGLSRIFVPVFKSDENINDFIVVSEQRDNIVTGIDENGSFVTVERATFEVAYFGTESGQYWVLEPFPRIIDTIDKEILLLFHYIDNVYLFSYINTKSNPDLGSVYIDQKTQVKHIFDFNGEENPKINAVAEFLNIMYMGLENGELWSYDGSVFSKVTTMSNPIRSLHGDENFLYIGLSNSSIISLYNGLNFFNSNMEP